MPEIRILLVENDDKDMFAFSHALNIAKVPNKITHCKSVEDALEKIQTEPVCFDLILSNYELSGKSGLEIFNEISSRREKIPFILITDPSSKELALDALNKGVDDYILKGEIQDYLNIIPNKVCKVIHKSDFFTNTSEKNILLENDELFRFILESTTDSILVLDNNYDSVFANEKMREYIKVLNENPKEVPDFMKYLKSRVESVFNTGKRLHVEDTVQSNGIAQYYESVFSPIKDDNNKIFAVGIVHRDITKRKRIAEELLKYKEHLEDFIGERTAELKDVNKKLRSEIAKRNLANINLEKSLSLLKATLEATADGIVVMDNDQKIVSFNKRFVNMCDIPRGIINSGDGNRVFKSFLKQLVDPEDFIVISEELTTQPFADSYEVIETKENRTFECYSHPQWIGDDIVGRVWSFRDVTDRKRAQDIFKTNEEQYNIIFNSISDAIVIMDLNGNILDANQQVSNISGYSYNELVNSQFKKLIHPTNYKTIKNIKKEIKAKSSSLGDFIGMQKDGSIVNIEYLGKLLNYNGTKKILLVLKWKENMGLDDKESN